ncbi:MAG: hypothetical protein V7711_19105, partial [Pseudomonadales bacterium]
MAYPRDIKIIDLMLGIPSDDGNAAYYEGIKSMLMDEESHSAFSMPAQYMFKDSVPKIDNQPDYIAYTLEQM